MMASLGVGMWFGDKSLAGMAGGLVFRVSWWWLFGGDFGDGGAGAGFNATLA